MTPRQRGWALVAAQFGCLALLFLTPTGGTWPAPPGSVMIRSVALLSGGALVFVGAARLGSGARVHPAPAGDAQLRTTGPYRFARHPIYTGVLIIGFGAAVTGRTLLHGAAFGTLVLVLAVKARFEEQLLRAKFPGYRAYAARTGRFLPGIGRTG